MSVASQVPASIISGHEREDQRGRRGPKTYLFSELSLYSLGSTDLSARLKNTGLRADRFRTQKVLRLQTPDFLLSVPVYT